MPQNNCRCGYPIDKPGRCQAYGKSCARCGKANQFEQVCWNQGRKVSEDGYRQYHRADHDLHQDAKESEETVKEFSVIRSKIFNFHIVQSVIAKLRTRISQKAKNMQ